MPGRGEDVDDDRIIEVVRAVGPRATTAEVAERLPIKQTMTRRRLKTLMDRGEIDGMKVANAWLWSAVD